MSDTTGERPDSGTDALVNIQDGGWTASAAAWIARIDAGEENRERLLDAVILEQCGDVAGLKVLDLGCGEGRFARMLAHRGGETLGIDPTRPLVGAAAERHPHGFYARAVAEYLPFANERFDLIVSYLSMVDIADFRTAVKEIARVMRPGGRLVVANLGFVTASQGWARDQDGRRLYHRVDRYAVEHALTLEWAGIRILNWHRPLSSYMTAYLEAGLTLESFLEPVPADESLKADPRFEDWFRVPLFNVMRWRKLPPSRTPSPHLNKR